MQTDAKGLLFIQNQSCSQFIVGDVPISHIWLPDIIAHKLSKNVQIYQSQLTSLCLCMGLIENLRYKVCNQFNTRVFK